MVWMNFCANNRDPFFHNVDCAVTCISQQKRIIAGDEFMYPTGNEWNLIKPSTYGEDGRDTHPLNHIYTHTHTHTLSYWGVLLLQRPVKLRGGGGGCGKSIVRFVLARSV